MSLNKLGLILLATTFSVSAFANNETDTNIAADTAVVDAEKQPQITTQEVYVIQGQDQKQGQGQDAETQSAAGAEANVVSQPTTIVEASPLVESRATQLRSTRQQAEIETEQKIVEKLESSRLEDEQRRAKKLFGGKLEREEEADVKVVVKDEVPAPTPAPQIVIIEKEKESPIHNEVKEDLSEIAKEESSEEGRMSVGGQLGVLEYNAGNIESDMAVGASLGWMMDSGVQIEASFNYSNHILNENYNDFQEMEQYSWAMAAKYSFLKTAVRPVVGGVLGITRRNYTVAPWSSFYNSGSFDSTSFDAGALVGADIKVSDNIYVGADYRYMMNLTTRFDYPENVRNYQVRIEEDGYSIFSASLKFLF